MQERLFTEHADVDLDADPYEEYRELSRRIADRWSIESDEAYELLLFHGSEAAVERTLQQRWWLTDDDDEPAAKAA